MEDIKSDMLKAIEKEKWDKLSGILEQEGDVLVEEGVTDILQAALTNNAPDEIITNLVSLSNINMHNKGDDSALHLVLRHGRWQLVPVLLQKGADVNVRGKDKETPLHTAVWESAPLDIIAKLISPDNINMSEQRGNTCLCLSIYKSNWELIPILIYHGASIKMSGAEKQGSLLSLAIAAEAPASVLLQLVSDKNINVKDDTDGNTPLHKVLLKEQWGAASGLIQVGADINICNKKNETPLHVAVSKYRYDDDELKDIIPQLISLENINMEVDYRNLVISNALQEQNWELASLFIQKGADISGESREYLMRLALAYGTPKDIVTQLIYPPNINDPDSFGKHLYVAVEKKRWALVPIFVQHGADINLEVQCDTPLHEAIRKGAPVETITQLISPQNINMRYASDLSPLLVAIHNNRLESVPVLIQHGADPPVLDTLPEPQPTLSLKSLCIATIRSHMPVKSDEAFKELGLPQALLPELKLEPLADEIVADEQMRKTHLDDFF